MDTRSVIARFEAERQALAMMDHPNIAKVLDAGTTDTGRPYFVMELVRGIKITDYCDQNNLSTGQRLELFVQVCHAVQHAHQKAIIHRDLKPSNILVTLHDGVPVPKIIDFGIAKATEGRLTDLTVYTELHQFIGTPAYMSPEQAEMSGLDIDTRSDIYSLGVLLYELLTGKTPFDPKELARLGLDQMRRTIREQEPERPSTRLSTLLDADLTNTAKRRSAEPPRLIHLIRGDLDWIVMKALEKDRTRRFETANDLAMDVRRFLNNDPIEARPPSTLYRFQKLVRRNKTVFAAVAAVAAALILGLGVSIFLFIKEKQAYRRAVAAELQESRLRQQAEASAEHEKRMREIGNKLTTAGELIAQDQADKAEALMKEVTPVPQSHVIYNGLGYLRVLHGEWLSAIANYSNSIAVEPTNHIASHCLAPLFLQAGQPAAYDEHRARMLRQFAPTRDPDVAARTAEDCLILPPTAAELTTIGELVDTALAAGPAHASWHFFEFVKGLAEYRVGHFATAVEWLQKALTQPDNGVHALAAQAVLAMAQHQLGQAENARATLAEAVQRLQATAPKLPVPTGNDQMTAQLLVEQAQALIGQPAQADHSKP
jgi:hypothetical protein